MPLDILPLENILRNDIQIKLQTGLGVILTRLGVIFACKVEMKDFNSKGVNALYEMKISRRMRKNEFQFLGIHAFLYSSVPNKRGVNSRGV